MAGSLDLTTVAAIEQYVVDNKRELLKKLFFSNPTGMIVRIEDNVKGKRRLTELIVGALARRYRRSFNPRVGAIDFQAREIETHLIDVDLEINPTDFEGSYMGEFRRQGQDITDIPFEGEIMDQVLAKLASELEINYWRAIATGTPAEDDLIGLVFDGVHKILADEVAASNLTPVITGTITNTNAVASVRNMYKALGPQYQLGNMDLFINPADAILYMEDYQERYGATAQAFNGGNTMHLDIGAINVHKCPGVKVGAPVMTPKENLVLGLDGLDDARMFRFKEQIKSIEMSLQFRYGAQIGIVDNDIISINENN